MNVNDVHRGIHTNRSRRRLGRGIGSGQGKTAGRGHKGQKSRSGWSRQSIFQGAAMPLVRRVPKRGFHNRFALEVAVVNVGDLESAFQPGDQVTPQALREKSLAKGYYDILKILGNGPLTAALLSRLLQKCHVFPFPPSAVNLREPKLKLPTSASLPEVLTPS